MSRGRHFAGENEPAVKRSIADLSATALEELGKEMIKQKALDVARQVAIYLAGHQAIINGKISQDSALAEIAVQPVGKTGYTCMYEKETALMRFHNNPELIDFDMHNWREKLPSWWKIFEPSLNGSIVGGYYDWEDADGSIRRKFMYMVPVEGTQYMVAATTYIDEFLEPSREIRTKIASLEQEVEERAREMAVLEERNRLARDLHDAVSQTLFSASLIAEVLPRLWERDQDEGRRRLEEVRQLSRSALAEMRTLLFELRPAALAEAELGDLLRQLADTITGRGRLPVTVEISSRTTLPSEVKVAFYRIAQEALNNVAKHSGATEAKVNLDCQMDKAILTVSDNGRGFDKASLPADSLGIGIMRERAEAVGAGLEIESKAERGTVVKVTWMKKPGEEV